MSIGNVIADDAPVPPDSYRGWYCGEPEPEPCRRVGVQGDRVERESHYQPVRVLAARTPLFGNIFMILLIILITFAAGFLCAVWMGSWARPRQPADLSMLNPWNNTPADKMGELLTIFYSI